MRYFPKTRGERRVFGSSHPTIADASTNRMNAMKLHAGRPLDLADLHIFPREAGVATRRKIVRLHKLRYGTEPMAPTHACTGSNRYETAELAHAAGTPSRRDRIERRRPRRGTARTPRLTALLILRGRGSLRRPRAAGSRRVPQAPAPRRGVARRRI